MNFWLFTAVIFSVKKDNFSFFTCLKTSGTGLDLLFLKFIFNHKKGGNYDTGKKKWKLIKPIAKPV